MCGLLVRHEPREGPLVGTCSMSFMSCSASFESTDSDIGGRVPCKSLSEKQWAMASSACTI